MPAVLDRPRLADASLEERRTAARKVCAQLARDGGWTALVEAVRVTHLALFPERAEDADDADR